jgi:hypothetical protein
VHLVDAHHCTDPAKFIAAVLLSLTAMIRLEAPAVHVLSKLDMLEGGAYGRPAFGLDFYAEVGDLQALVATIREGGGSGGAVGRSRRRRRRRHGSEGDGGGSDGSDAGTEVIEAEAAEEEEEEEDSGRDDSGTGGRASDQEEEEDDGQRVRRVVDLCVPTPLTDPSAGLPPVPGLTSANGRGGGGSSGGGGAGSGGDVAAAVRSGAARGRSFLQRYRRFNAALAEIVEDHNLVAFVPMSVKVSFLGEIPVGRR